MTAAASRAEREIVAHLLVLDEQFGNVERLDDRVQGRIADSKAADRTGSGQIVFDRVPVMPTARWPRSRSLPGLRPLPTQAPDHRFQVQAGREQRWCTPRGSGDGRPHDRDWASAAPQHPATLRWRWPSRNRWQSSGRGRPSGGISRVRNLVAIFSQISACSPARARSSDSSASPAVLVRTL